jgi:hypothetical protein
MTHPFTPTYGPVPPGPLAGPLQLLPVNAAVVAVHTAMGRMWVRSKRWAGCGSSRPWATTLPGAWSRATAR